MARFHFHIVLLLIWAFDGTNHGWRRWWGSRLWKLSLKVGWKIYHRCWDCLRNCLRYRLRNRLGNCLSNRLARSGRSQWNQDLRRETKRSWIDSNLRHYRLCSTIYYWSSRKSGRSKCSWKSHNLWCCCCLWNNVNFGNLNRNRNWNHIWLFGAS